MADSKKYNGSTWRHSLRKLGTDTDTFTTLPTNIITDGTNASIGLVGNMSQTGTPTPDSPVMPQGTGDKTANLFDKSTLENGIYLAANGNKYGDITNGVRAGVKIKALPNTAYTLSAQSSANVSLRIFEWSNGTFIKQTPKYNISGNISLTVTTDAETTEIVFNIEGVNAQYATSIMLNSGLTPLPYEPWGYKIPILSAGQTTPVYLGEVETTRKVKKVVLDGTEAFYASGSWGKTNTAVYYTALPNAANLSTNVAYTKCSHYVGASRNYIYDNDIECSGMTGSNSLTFRVNRQYAGTKEDFLAYLAAQYAAGTPVTVWYVLANEETAVVNEPLMKIGDYVDTLSKEQAGVQIPTLHGNTVIDVETTLKPSEVSLTYTGWHDAEVKEWDGSEWQ